MYFPSNGTFDLMYYPYYGKKAQVGEYFQSMDSLNSEMFSDLSVFLESLPLVWYCR